MDKVNRRCSICDYFEADGGSSGRKFVLDSSTNEHHCYECMSVIRDDIGYNYWQATPIERKQAELGRQRALEGRQSGKEFRGYTPTGDEIYRPGAPTSADLEAIEVWEDLLKEMDLGSLEEVD